MRNIRTGILIAATFAVVGWARPSAATEPTLTWLGHAAFEYKTRIVMVVLIEPWLMNPEDPKSISLKRVDAILVAHAYSVHVGEAFDLAKKYNASLFASYELTQIA